MNRKSARFSSPGITSSPIRQPIRAYSPHAKRKSQNFSEKVLPSPKHRNTLQSKEFRSSTMKSILDNLPNTTSLSNSLMIENRLPIQNNAAYKPYSKSIKNSTFMQLTPKSVNQRVITPIGIGSANRSHAQLIYDAHFSGLESVGATGMTVLEELIDIALRSAENSGIQSTESIVSRGAALLCSTGDVYTGCDIFIKGVSNHETNGIIFNNEATIEVGKFENGMPIFYT